MIERIREINRLRRRGEKLQKVAGQRNDLISKLSGMYDTEPDKTRKFRLGFTKGLVYDGLARVSRSRNLINRQIENIADEGLREMETPTQTTVPETEIGTILQVESPVSIKKPEVKEEGLGTPVEISRKPKAENITLRFKNGREATMKPNQQTKVLEKLITRRRTIGQLTSMVLEKDTPENRENLVRWILPRARKIAEQNENKIVRKVINGESYYSLQQIRHAKKQQEPVAGITIERVPAARLDEILEQEEKESKAKLTKESKKTFTILGREIEVTGGRNIEVVGNILEGFKDINDLAELSFHENTKVTRNRIPPVIFGLNKRTFAAHRIELINVNKGKKLPAYYDFSEIQETTEELIQDETQPGQRTEAVAERRVIDAAKLAPKEIPYEPTEDEIRSTEEARVLEKIVEQLSRSEKIDFGSLQRALRIDIRMRILQGGQKQYRPYQVEELKKLFESGIKKLSEEAVLPPLKEKWTENDILTWDRIRKQSDRYANSDFNEYIRQVNRKIEAAAKALGSHIPAWLNLQ